MKTPVRNSLNLNVQLNSFHLAEKFGPRCKLNFPTTGPKVRAGNNVGQGLTLAVRAESG